MSQLIRIANLRAVFAILALTGWVSVAHAETWYRADTDNFVVYSTGRESDLRQRALDLERFDALMRLRYRIPSTPSPNRAIVYLVDDEKAIMRAIACRKYGGVAGFYSDQIDGSYFVSHRRQQSDRTALSPEEVLFHEYGHHFMFRYFPFAYPGWYREGFAEYYATTEFDAEGNWTYGKPPLYRGYTLNSSRRQISAERMLTVPQSDLSDEESYQVYTRGWLLVHMLHSDPERNRQLNVFLTDVARGMPKDEAARAAFGDLDELERDMRRYMRESPTYIRGREPITYDGRFDIAQLDDIDSEFEQLRLDNRRSCDREDTRDRLINLAENAPDRPHIWNELADAHHMIAHSDAWKQARENAGKDAEDENIKPGEPDMRWALATVERALELDPDNARANALKAEFLMDQARHREDPALWNQARSHAIAANRVNPDNPFPLSLYYDTHANSESGIDETARAALARAFELAPEVDQVRTKYALDLALQGDYDRALQVVDFLVSAPHSENVGKLAVAKIEALRSGTPFSEVAEMEYEEEDDDDGDEGDDA